MRIETYSHFFKGKGNTTMKVNYISNTFTTAVEKRNEIDVLKAQPDVPKTKLAMFNYWDEQKRSDLTENATLSRLVLDYDDGPTRDEVEHKFNEFGYIIYNSTGNTPEHNKFRLILTLSEPITAHTMKHWRGQNTFHNFFDGVDFSTFSVGRFFYIPSKFDKNGDAVKVDAHRGKPFDFHSMFKAQEYFQPFEALKAKLKSDRFNKAVKQVPNPTEVLQQYAEKEEWHYINAIKFASYAKYIGADEFTALHVFLQNYAGHSNMQKAWPRIWNAAK